LIYAYHRNDFGFHLSDSREDIRMDRVCDAELAKSLGLKLEKIFTTMIHRTADTAILPAGVFQTGQLVEFLPDLICRPTFRGESQIAIYVRSTLHKLRFEIGNGSRNLLVDLAADAWGAEEDRVAEQTDGNVDIADTSEETVAAKRVEGFARISKEEQNEDNIS
jgi:hypothetical protein